MKLIFLSLVLVSVAVFLLSVRVLFKRNGQFPNTHVGGQKALRDKGISCHTSQHRTEQERRTLSERLSERE